MIDDAAFRFAVFAAPREAWEGWLELGRSDDAGEALARAAGFAAAEARRPRGYVTVIVLTTGAAAPSVRLHEAEAAGEEE